MKTEDIINNNKCQYYKGSKMHSFTGTKGFVPTTAKTIKMHCNIVCKVFLQDLKLSSPDEKQDLKYIIIFYNFIM